MNRTGRSEVAGSGALRLRVMAGVVVLASVLAACSSSDADPAAEPTVSSEPTPDSIEEPETTTTSTTTTTTTTTTASTTIAPTTTTTGAPPVVNTVEPEATDPAPETTVDEPVPEPTNTTFDPATLEGEVEQAVLANAAAFVACLDELPNCDVGKATVNALFAYQEGNARLMNEWNAAGYVARNTDDQNYRVDKVEFSDIGNEAIVTYCAWGGAQLVLPATESSAEAIIEGGYTSSINTYLVEKVGDAWFVTASDEVESSEGVEQNICV